MQDVIIVIPAIITSAGRGGEKTVGCAELDSICIDLASVTE